MKNFERNIKNQLLEAIESMPVVLLRGARQTGKTTMMRSLLTSHGEYRYLSFDHLPTFAAARDDPVGFISRLQTPVILDEIQRVPELFLPIKSAVDADKKPGSYLLTGSADPLLIPKLGDSLAGRMRILNLFPLSQSEIANQHETFLYQSFHPSSLVIGRELPCSQENLLMLTMQGGYPGPLQMTSEKQRQAWFNDYISLVLQKDVMDLARIEHVTQMPHLLMALASRVGGLLNSEELARALKLPTMTLHRYLDLLRTLFLVYLVPAWSGNLYKRLVKSPKVYLIDTALQLYLLDIDKQRLIQDSKLFGKVVENFVILELIKQISWSDQRIRMYHFRDYSQSEIDIILEGPGGKLVGIEIKSSETITKDDFKALKKFNETAGDMLVQGIVLYAGNTILPFGDKFTACPIASLWN